MIGTANAGVIEFDFTGGTGNHSSIDFSAGGLTTTATATWNGFTNTADVSNDRHHNTDSHGIGVKNNRLDSGQVDGFIRNDYLTFTFDTIVELTGFNFSHDSGNDEFDLYVDGLMVERNQETTDGFLAFAPSSYMGTAFSVRANQNNDNFYVSGMQITTVVEPGTLALLGLGLAGLGYSRRSLKA